MENEGGGVQRGIRSCVPDHNVGKQHRRESKERRQKAMWAWRIGLIGWLGVWFASVQAEARCPVARRPVCRVGFSPIQESFRIQGQICRRWICRRLPCPVLSRPSCAGGRSAFRVTYSHQGQTCHRWSCPPPLRAFCPSVQSLSCGRGSKRVRVSYAYRGRRCWRWICRPLRR